MNSGTNRRTWVRWSFLFLLYPSIAIFAEPPSRPQPVPEIEIPGGISHRSELALCDARGTVLRRYTGLDRISHLVSGGTDTFFVTDSGEFRIIEMDLEGNLLWSWQPPHGVSRPMNVTPLENGMLLVAAEHGEAYEIDREGEIYWRMPGFDPGAGLTCAMRLTDGTRLLASRRCPLRLYHVFPEQPEPVTIAPGIEEGRCNVPGMAPWQSGTNRFVLWDNDWQKAFLMEWSGTEPARFEHLPLPRLLTVVSPDGKGGCAFVAEDLKAGYWHPPKQPILFETLYQADAIATVGDGERFLIGYIRLPDARWPESRLTGSFAPPFDWPRFWRWVFGALVFGAGLHLVAFLWNRRKPELPEFPASTAAEPPVCPLVSKPWFFHPLRAALALIAGAGMYGSWQNALTLYPRPAPDAVYRFIGGALLAAFSLQLWRRVLLRRPDSWWWHTVRTRPSTREWPAFLIGSLGLAVGAILLFRIALKEGNVSDQVGLWVGMLVLIAFMIALSFRPFARASWTWIGKDLPLLLIPLTLGAITFGYQLGSVPANFHGDSVSYAIIGVDLLEGRYPNVFHHGEYPWPVIGNWIDAVGARLVGFGTVGLRLGSVLFCLSAIVAVYLLGKSYRDRFTGLLASILLTGSTAFMHMARINYPGEAATVAIWAITLFSLAIRHGHPGLWMAAGLAFAHTFLIYPSGRPAPVAALLGGFLLALRSPGRVTLPRWFGPLLTLLAVLAVLSPVFPNWLATPAGLFPRMQDVGAVYRPSDGVDRDSLRQVFGEPFFRSLGWFFAYPDNSTQGSLSPGCNPIEGTLLAVGMGLVLMEGLSLNVLLGVYLLTVLVTCGAFVEGPPWSIRLVPTIPVAVVLMARTVSGFGELLHGCPRWVIRGAAVLAVLAGIAISPVRNFREYYLYETGRKGQLKQYEMTALGRKLAQLGPEYSYYLVLTGRADLSADWNRRTARLHELLPFVWNLRIREVRDLQGALPLPENESFVVILPEGRFWKDGERLKTWYPEAEIQEVRDWRGQHYGGLVILDRQNRE